MTRKRKAGPAERALRRAHLAQWELPTWKPLRFVFEAGGGVEIWSIGEPAGPVVKLPLVEPRPIGEDFLVAKFNLETLRGEMSVEHFRLFKLLLERLAVQAAAAADAMPIARLELTVADGRSRGGQKTAAPRKAERAEADAKLKAAAESMLAARPGMFITDLAQLLERRGLGGASTIRKKLTRLLKKR